MDKDNLEKLKENLNTIKNKFGIPVLSIALIISIVSCHYKGKEKTEEEIPNESVVETITEALTEATTEEITEAIKEITTQEITTEQITSEEVTQEITTEESITIDDEYVINDFKERKEEIKKLIDKDDIENAKVKAREYFIKSVDFIFYDTQINGITFDNLKEDSKQVLFNELCEMDEIIESISPDYKENLSEKYAVVKDFTKEKYYYSLDKIKEYIGEERYDKISEMKDNTKERVEEFKDDHQDEIDEFKDNAKEKTDEYKLKLKNWYENYRDE